MKAQNKILLIVLAILITAIATIYWRDVTFTLPAASLLGSFIILAFILILLINDSLRFRTNQITWIGGHSSIRDDDIFFLPYQEVKLKEEKKGTPFNEELAVCMTGGMHYGKSGITFGGPVDFPVLIFPSIYLRKTGHSYNCKAHMDIIPFIQLPLYVQDHLIGLIEKGDLKSRIDYKETPIWYGNLSIIDGSLTKENLAAERDFKQHNQEVSNAESRINRLYDDIRKNKDSSSKDIIVPISKFGKDEES